MPSIAAIILDDTNSLTAADWDYDPTVGDGSNLSEIDAPTGYDESSILISPYI
jgi:hypothetical protein